MTYAKFGALIKKHPRFGEKLEIIVCDEVHNLIRFERFETGEEQKHLETARKRLQTLVRSASPCGPLIIGMSATPDAAERRLECPITHITVDSDVHCYRETERSEYMNLEALLSGIKPGTKGIVYIHTIDRMKRYEDQLCGQGVSCVSVWSTHNQDHTMNEEQLSVRQHILDREEIPPQYDVLLINASSETSINIRGEV